MSLPPKTDPELQCLLEKIKVRYDLDIKKDYSRFPQIRYNKNRRNYESLVKSISEDLKTKNIDVRERHDIAIPGESTLANFFCLPAYGLGQASLNALYVYVEGIDTLIINTERENSGTEAVEDGCEIEEIEENGEIEKTEEDVDISNNPPKKKKHIYYYSAGLLFMLGLGIGYNLSFYPEHRISILNVSNKQRVPRILMMEGKAKQAQTIWIVVKAYGDGGYYVQAPIEVLENGTWKGKVIIGSVGNEDVGHAYKLKALINPRKVLHTGDILTFWPSGEYSSDELEVIRDIN